MMHNRRNKAIRTVKQQHTLSETQIKTALIKGNPNITCDYVEIKCQLDATDDIYCRYHLLHLVGILFPHNNDDARSKPLQITRDVSPHY